MEESTVKAYDVVGNWITHGRVISYGVRANDTVRVNLAIVLKITDRQYRLGTFPVLHVAALKERFDDCLDVYRTTIECVDRVTVIHPDYYDEQVHFLLSAVQALDLYTEVRK